MGGGSIQLLSNNIQNSFITGNPQITFFKAIYRRHTNFSIDTVRQTMNSAVKYSSTFSCTLTKNGDLAHKMYLEYTAEKYSEGLSKEFVSNKCNNLLNPSIQLIKNVAVHIADTKIDEHTGNWLETYTELVQDPMKPVYLSVGQCDNATYKTHNPYGGVCPQEPGSIYPNPSPLQADSGMGGLHILKNSLYKLSDKTSVQQTYRIPLQFWFNRNPGLALPLLVLNNQSVLIKVSTNSKNNTINCNDDGEILSSNNIKLTLLTDIIFLDTEERRRFINNTHDYLIEQVNTLTQSISADNTSTNIDIMGLFNKPVKYLVFNASPNTSNTYKNTYEYGGLNNNSHLLGVKNDIKFRNSSLSILFNGQERIPPRSLNYFTEVQLAQHFKGRAIPYVDRELVDKDYVKKNIINYLSTPPTINQPKYCKYKYIRTMLNADSNNDYYLALLNSEYNMRFKENPNSIGVYSFAINPNEHQPSGICDSNNLESASLVINGQFYPDTKWRIYSVNYNILRISYNQCVFKDM